MIWPICGTGPRSTKSDLAFLQYTSGSTSDPKGVMVSHANLLANLERIRQSFGIGELEEDVASSTGVSWLPAYHDMGLIGGILTAMYMGGRTVLMSPTAFLQRPMRWLQAIQRLQRDHQRCAEFRLRVLRAADQRGRAGNARLEPLAAGVLRRRADSLRDAGPLRRSVRRRRLQVQVVPSLLRSGRVDAAGGGGRLSPGAARFCPSIEPRWPSIASHSLAASRTR